MVELLVRYVLLKFTIACRGYTGNCIQGELTREGFVGVDGEGGGSMCESMHVEKDSDPRRAEVLPAPSVQHQSMNTHVYTHTHL